MWQVHEAKVIVLTRGGLTSEFKLVITMNGEESAEAIVPCRPNEEKKPRGKG